MKVPVTPANSHHLNDEIKLIKRFSLLADKRKKKEQDEENKALKQHNLQVQARLNQEPNTSPHE
jgi:hypothetical protein